MVKMELIAGSYEEVLLSLSLTKDDDEYKLIEKFTEKSIGSIKCVAVSEKGLLACGGIDEIIRVYNLKLNRLVGTLNHHSGTVTSLQFTDTHLFSCSDDGTLCLWRISSWEPERTFKGHKGPVKHLGVHPSGKLTLTVSQDKTLRLWNNMTGRLSYISNLKESAELITWSPNGNHYLVTYKTKIEVYSVTEKGLVRSIDAYKVNSIVFITDTLMVYGGEAKIGSEGRRKTDLFFVDILEGTCALQLNTESIRIRGLTVCPSQEQEGQKWLTYVGSDGAVGVYCVTAAEGKVTADLMVYRSISLRFTSLAATIPQNFLSHATKPVDPDRVQKKKKNRKRKHTEMNSPSKMDVVEPSEKLVKTESEPVADDTKPLPKANQKKNKIKKMKQKATSAANNGQSLQPGSVEHKKEKLKKLNKTITSPAAQPASAMQKKDKIKKMKKTITNLAPGELSLQQPDLVKKKKDKIKKMKTKLVEQTAQSEAGSEMKTKKKRMKKKSMTVEN